MRVCEYLNVWVHASARNEINTETKAFVSETVPVSVSGSLSMSDCMSICLVSSLWEYVMAKEHVCQREDKLKQDVPGPRSFEGVPHHTSDSVGGSEHYHKRTLCLP